MLLSPGGIGETRKVEDIPIDEFPRLSPLRRYLVQDLKINFRHERYDCVREHRSLIMRELKNNGKGNLDGRTETVEVGENKSIYGHTANGRILFFLGPVLCQWKGGGSEIANLGRLKSGNTEQHSVSRKSKRKVLQIKKWVKAENSEDETVKVHRLARFDYMP